MDGDEQVCLDAVRGTEIISIHILQINSCDSKDVGF